MQNVLWKSFQIRKVKSRNKIQGMTRCGPIEVTGVRTCCKCQAKMPVSSKGPQVDRFMNKTVKEALATRNEI